MSENFKKSASQSILPGERHQTVIAQYLVGWGRSPAVNSCPKILMGIAGAKFVFFIIRFVVIELLKNLLMSRSFESGVLNRDTFKPGGTAAV